ncbi:DUF3040 domain-containing protein [Jatrophihabitans sp. YIM 134969]
MPLSEHEQRLLDDIEKALYAEDPKFAASVRTAKRRRPGRRWIPVSIVGVLAGLGLVLLGLLLQNPIPAVAGFVLIVASVTYASVALRGGTAAPVDASSLTDSGSAGPGKRGSKAPATGIRARMEDRMRRRFEADGNSGGA